MRLAISLTTTLLLSSFFIPISNAHDTKEYTVILDERVTGNVPEGVLVETDYLFFRNEDSRDGVSHRIQFDADGDGFFGGSDDFSTSWLDTSCELLENGSKKDDSCMVAEWVLLAPENGLLPGNISLRHQIKEGTTITENEFFVPFGPDVHEDSIPQNIRTTPSQKTGDTNKDLLSVILFCSILGILTVLPSLLSPKKD